MIALVQRVGEAEVTLGDETVGVIGAGIPALIGSSAETTSGLPNDWPSARPGCAKSA
ncbi:MAG: hypothetical protein ACREUK_07070 [Burkholderiales bacterium]